MTFLFEKKKLEFWFRLYFLAQLCLTLVVFEKRFFSPLNTFHSSSDEKQKENEHANPTTFGKRMSRFNKFYRLYIVLPRILFSSSQLK